MPLVPATTTGTTITVSAVVALVVTAAINAFFRFAFADALSQRKAARDYEYDQRRRQHTLIGAFDGRLLEAAMDLYERLQNITRSARPADPAWLRPREEGSLGYFYASTVYRFIALMRLAIAFDREAIYFEPTITGARDLRFIRYAKAFQWVMTDVEIFDGTGYSRNESVDHFFRDEFRSACTLPIPVSEPLSRMRRSEAGS